MIRSALRTPGAPNADQDTGPSADGTSGPGTRRWTVFVHQDGVVLCTTLRALARLGVLEPSLTAERSITDLYPRITQAGFGYMRVGLRCLASQGWLDRAPELEPDATVLRWTEDGRRAARFWDRYVVAGGFLATLRGGDADSWPRQWDAAIRHRGYRDLIAHACDRWRLDAGLPDALRALIRTHLDAALVVPAMLWLRSADMITDAGPRLPPGDPGEDIGRLLTALGWVDGAGAWTAIGQQSAALSVHFGMAASYLPLLARLPELYSGDHVVVPQSDEAGEWHVNRGLNVTASAAAHARYFADADRIFLELFDREPVEAQPRFIADMGCGDGSWLVHLYRLIIGQTLRGARIADFPLLMVGLDYNRRALDQAQRVLTGAGVPALLGFGDIGDPDQVRELLAEQGVSMSDGLHVRAFIDHDRSYQDAGEAISVCGRSSGAYVDGRGRALDAAAVERDLVGNLRRWAGHVHRHGLVLLEAHCVDPRVARRHLGATHSVAFDAYHGYSHQYPIEHSAFLRCCREAGLRPESQYERRYPAQRPFVAVSLNRFLVPARPKALPAVDRSAERADTWCPDPGTDLEDGRALHALLYAEGDVDYPRSWCSAPTGFVVAGALQAVQARLTVAGAGDVIRVLDYGAGTGLAAIEFLKACQERGLEQRLRQRQASLELHLVDTPSSWFAQGYELLRGCAWTRFHSLRAAAGGFRRLLDVTDGHRVDAVMANMVFHLIPPQALQRAAADLAGVTAPTGSLVWSAPDLGPAGAYALLFHDANRALRRRWLELLGGRHPPHPDPSGRRSAPTAPLREAVRQAHRNFDQAARSRADARANRRVLPQANSSLDVTSALAGQFGGPVAIERQTHEILGQDVLQTLLVPSNQAELLPEITDRDLREEVIRELMLGEVLPALQDGAAGTALGLNVQWTLGSCAHPPPPGTSPASG